MKLQQFAGASAISSAQFYGRDESDMRGARQKGGQNIDLGGKNCIVRINVLCV